MSGNSTTFSIAHVNLSRSYGVSERQTVLLIKYVAALGLKQMLVCRIGSQIAAALKGTAGLTLLKLSGNDLRFSGHLKVARRYDIIHAHDFIGAQWGFIHYFMFGIPYLISTGFNEVVDDGFFARAVFLWARTVVAATDDTAYKLKEDFELDKVQVIASCVSELSFNQQNVRSIRASYKDRFLVGQIAPLINRKYCQTLLIDAARILLQKIPTLVILFIGEGDDGRLLAEHARGMSNIKFVDAKFSQIGDYIGAMDIFVSPVNQEDGLNIQIILDALDLGTPVITTDVRGIRTYIENGRSGIIIEKGNAEALADAILMLRDNIGLRELLVENGRMEAQKMSPEIMSMQYFDLYHNLLDSRGE